MILRYVLFFVSLICGDIFRKTKTACEPEQEEEDYISFKIFEFQEGFLKFDWAHTVSIRNLNQKATKKRNQSIKNINH